MNQPTGALCRDWIVAAAENANQLVVDALILMERGRWARTHALATLATEEVGKAFLLQNECFFDSKGRPAGHERKIVETRRMLALAFREGDAIDVEAIFSETHDVMAEYDYDTRMGGLYVDAVNGQVCGGTESIDEAEAHTALTLAHEAVHCALGWLRWVESDKPRSALV